MSGYEYKLPTHANSSFVEPQKDEGLYEDVICTTNLPEPHRNNKNDKGNTHSSCNCNIWMIISAISLVIGVAALAAAIGLFMSVLHNVDKFQDEQSYMQSNISSLSNRLSSQVNNIQNRQSQSEKTTQELSEALQQQQENFTHSENITQEQLNNLRQELVQGYKILDDGWVTPFNGYKYKATESRKTFETAWFDCYNMTANMANQGIRDLDTRRTLLVALSLSSSIWIGLSDYISERTWRWISSYKSYNGDYATEESALWYINHPYTGTSSYDCAFMRSDGYSFDTYCSNSYPALCEKPI